MRKKNSGGLKKRIPVRIKTACHLYSLLVRVHGFDFCKRRAGKCEKVLADRQFYLTGNGYIRLGNQDIYLIGHGSADRIFLRDNSIITFAQDKSLVSEEPASQGKGKNTSFYQILDLYIRLDPLQHQFLPENLNLQMER